MFLSAESFASDSLAEAFLAQCLKVQSCAKAKPETESMNPELRQMIETRMQGQCEAQLPKIRAMQDNYPGGAETMAECYRALSELSCDEFEARPRLSECPE